MCGKILGIFEFVIVIECVYYFEWRIIVVCKKDIFKVKKEVLCYVFDEELRKYDFNFLIKFSGVYLVDDFDLDIFLFINVCRDIDIF